jgi:hypothetical protein
MWGRPMDSMKLLDQGSLALVRASLRGAPIRIRGKRELLDSSRKIPSSVGICIFYLF